MWRAALSHTLVVGCALTAALALSVGAPPAEAAANRTAALPLPLWVLELSGSGAVSSSALASYRSQGFNAVLTHSRLSARRAASLRRAPVLHLRSRIAKPA